MQIIVQNTLSLPNVFMTSWNTQHLKRRGFDLGIVPLTETVPMPDDNAVKQAWQNDRAIKLPSLLNDAIKTYANHIKNAHLLMESVCRVSEITPFLEKAPYVDALKQNFFIVATSAEEHDAQGIEKIYIDAFVDDEENAVAEELWCKGSWLSFDDADNSLRFRFSWGMEGFEDVSSDPVKQMWAGKLCDVIFPESASITKNPCLLTHLEHILGKTPYFVERIVYFNAPNGGAQMHHDVERGHAGVVFAQLSGSTFWLAISKPKLMHELITFVTNEKHAADIQAVLSSAKDRQTLLQLCQNESALSDYMEEPDHEYVEAIIDRCPAFIQQLVTHGYSHTLEAGDVLLLPQRDIHNCVWHSVFTLGGTTGEALSFAVR